MIGTSHHLSFFALLINILPVLSLDHGLLATPAARVVLPRSQPTSWSLPHRVAHGEAVVEQPKVRRNKNLLSRQAGQQIPFQWCPEFFNNPPKLCSQCGGDSRIKGTCDSILVSGPQVHCGPVSLDGCLGYYCKCSDNGGQDNSPKVTSSTVLNNGETAIAVWEPLTLTEYKHLLASTTVTLSETATQSGISEVETVVAVVFAGGIAWWLAVQSGPAGAALSLQPPKQRPENSEDDHEQCSPEPKCKDCGGADGVGLCNSGDKAGCPCDEEKQNCDNANPPKCSTCGRGDGESKCLGEGEKKGCKCCPDSVVECSADNCKGDKSGKCQGDPLKACACRRVVTGSPVDIDLFYQSVPDDLAIAAAKAAFSDVWHGDTALVPGYPQPPFCVHSESFSGRVSPYEYCKCGKDLSTTYSLARGPTPCPFNPSSTGVIVTFTSIQLKQAAQTMTIASK